MLGRQLDYCNTRINNVSAYIKLSQGKESIIDEDMFDYLNQWKWHVRNGYAARTMEGSRNQGLIFMHRLIAGTKKGMETDHINRNTLDNRRSNLRNCTKSQNQANSKLRSDNSSCFRGVHWDKVNRKYRSSIRFSGKRICLGCFDDPGDAARAYDDAAKKYFGEFANLNFK